MGSIDVTDDSDDSDDTDSDDDDSDDDSDSIDVTDDSDDDSDDTDSDDTDTDSDSDEDTTDSDDNSFAAAFSAQKEAENVLMDRLEAEEGVDNGTQEGLLTVSLSKSTMANLWGIFALFTAVNITLCVWCHLKANKGRKRVRFVEDRYDSEIPIDQANV